MSDARGPRFPIRQHHRFSQIPRGATLDTALQFRDIQGSGHDQTTTDSPELRCHPVGGNSGGFSKLGFKQMRPPFEMSLISPPKFGEVLAVVERIIFRTRKSHLCSLAFSMVCKASGIVCLCVACSKGVSIFSHAALPAAATAHSCLLWSGAWKYESSLQVFERYKWLAGSQYLPENLLPNTLLFSFYDGEGAAAGTVYTSICQSANQRLCP